MKSTNSYDWIVPIKNIAIKIVTGQTVRSNSWAMAKLIPCPICGSGKMQWAEAGYVPGYRICDFCGRGFIISPFTEKENEFIGISIPQAGNSETEWEIDCDEPADWEWVKTGSGADLKRWDRYSRGR